MPEHTPFEVERNRLLGQEPDSIEVPPGPTPFQTERGRLLAGPTAFELERQRLTEESGAETPEGIGFLKGLELLMTGGDTPAEERAIVGALGAGIIEGAILKPAEALAQIPGLLGFNFGEKTVDFLQRAQIGLHSKAEQAGLSAGMTEQEIASMYAGGDFIGFVAPISASLKSATFLLRAPTLLRRHAITGNLVTELTAGAIFGGVFRPADSYEDRIKNLARESAAFGVTRIGINALVLPFRSFRNNRVAALERKAGVEQILENFRNGEGVIVKTPEQSIALSKLLSEESYVTNSSAAQEILTRFQDESTLIRGIIDAGEAGQASGFVEGLSGTFPEIGQAIAHLETQFPRLKFDTVRRPGGLSVHFGFENLGSAARAQLKRDGRIAGQRISKNGVSYEFVKQEGDKLVVKTASGRVTRIKDENITNHFTVTETLEGVSPAETLYQDFSRKLQEGIDGLNLGGATPEQEIIRRIRAGEVVITNEARRPFDVGGAVIYPEELGRGRIPGLLTAEETTEAILLGERDAFVLERPNVMSFESMVEQWARNSELPADAPDLPALKAYFGQRAREDFWRSVPNADMAVLDAIKAEQHALVEAGEIPFNAYAHNKGFSVEQGDGGTVILRDLLTGRRIQFANEKVALTGLDGTIRPEGDILGGSILPTGTHGVGGFTGGFRPSDGVFTFDGTVPTREFIRDLPLSSFMQNNRDMFVRIEGQTGIPLFSEVFSNLDIGLTAQRNFVEPWALKIESVWKGMKPAERVEVAEVWRSLEGTAISIADRTAAARAAGLNAKQLRAFKESRELFDVWGEMAGLKETNQWIEGYYGRIRPYAESTGGHVRLAEIYGDEASIPPEFKFFAEQHRVGDMSMVEMDPEIVMHKYIKSLGFKLHTGETYNSALRLVSEKTTPKIGDLPPAQASNLLRQARLVDPTVDLTTPILPPTVRSVLGEYLNTVRGNPITAQGTMRRWGRNFFEKIGIRTDERVLEQYMNNGLTMMYGSAMGLKPSLWARNATQTIWMSYTRMGAKHGGAALDDAMNMKGWQEVVDVGVIRNVEAGLPAADAMFQSMMDANSITSINPRNPVSLAIASAMRAGIRLGNVGSKVAQKMLVPYGEQDAMNRAWSYFWHKRHVSEHLDRFNARKISWEKFEEVGLPFFHRVIRREFGSRYNSLGREDALRWIAKQGADESEFIYGVGAQPAWMQKPVGRFIGMFGTWPMWAIEAYMRRTRSATYGQTAMMYARTAALTGAFANMSIQTGINMWGWIAPASVFGWSGGPAVDYAIQLKRVYDSPLDQKADALGILGSSVARMSLPGQGFVRDIRRSLGSDIPVNAAMQMLLGRPIDEYNYAMDFLYDPRFNEGYEPTAIGQESIRALRGLEDFPSQPIHQLTSPVSRSVSQPGSVPP